MAYEPKTWVTGEVITAEKLNHIEQGIETATTLYVTVTQEDTTYTLSHSYTEIYNAVTAGKNVYIIVAEEGYFEKQGAFTVRPSSTDLETTYPYSLSVHINASDLNFESDTADGVLTATAGTPK